ncbi:Vps52 / Sac2 family isoform 1 [Hibiscus syriacus]|uniref:Vps52 / Sac2 family isoform 1 n=1 Tax=Hibiscus syriacus TaxID=106335 RepID=A0A6A3CY68_HIBSY|nr:Vps52 / Sac2 family isoform 1 [Hibiscus syriacus]
MRLLLLLLVCYIGLCNGSSLLPFMDNQYPVGGSLLLPDPLRVLEQIPLALEKDESVALSPARVDWKETPEGHTIMLDVPGLKKEEQDRSRRKPSAEGECVKAKLEDGVLTLSLAKLSPDKIKGPRVVDIAGGEALKLKGNDAKQEL